MAKFITNNHLVRSPTLLIGVGGIGGEIVRMVNDMLSDYDRSCISMLVMDTDSNALDKFMGSDIPYVQTSRNQTVQDYLAAYPEYLDWFPTDPFINGKNLIDGAGQIRSVSRLGALAAKGEGGFNAIRTAAEEILSNQGDTLNRAVRVMIVGSITGGTGSGLGIQLPFYIRKVLSELQVPNVLVRGLFLMPSLTEGKQDTESKKSAVNVNGYAFLKELNAFYRAQVLPAGKNNLRVEEYVPGLTVNGTAVKVTDAQKAATARAAEVPYNFLYLVEKQGNQGKIGEMEDYLDRCAQVVRSQLFAPASAQGFSSEDNLITAIVPQHGMNRYCGAGLSNAIYPLDEVRAYCTNRYAQNLLGNYWLQVDDVFRAREAQQRRLRKTNPHIDPLKKSEAFCTIFDEMCDPAKTNVVSEVAALNAELFIKLKNADGVVMQQPLVDSLYDGIEAYLDTVFGESGIREMSDNCPMTCTVNSAPTAVINEVTAKMEALRAFTTDSKKKVSELVVSAAEAILPSDLKLAQQSSATTRHNIYMALRDKHPLIARYVLYALLKRLKEKKESADITLNTLYENETIFETDYYEEVRADGGKDTHRETPPEALRKVKKGLLHQISLYSAEYKNLVRRVIDDVSDNAATILDIARNSLDSITCNVLIERIEMLIELYEQFFGELYVIMEDKKKAGDNLEAGRGKGINSTYFGDRYICSDAACKKVLYAEFTDKIGDEAMSMSDEVKTAFFNKMFKEYETRLLEKTNESAQYSHLSYRELFDEGILAPITSQFSKSGYAHLDMSILDAIYKQYTVERGANAQGKDSNDFAGYFRDLCNTMSSLAAPYIAYDTQVAGYTSGGRLAYSWGLSHSGVADYQTGEPNGQVDSNKLRDLFDRPTDLLVPDDSYSPYKMVCYSSIYDLRIEHCASYRRGTPIETYYNERLEALANRSHFVLSANEDNWVDVIHPHLDRRWHEHAFLPELMEYDDISMCRDIRVAFLLALALQRCYYKNIKEEHLECWFFQDSDEDSPIPIKAGDDFVTSKSVLALRKAFEYNRVMVRKLNEYIADLTEKAYNDGAFGGISEEDVAKQPIILALRGDANDAEKRCILDILYDLYAASGDLEQVKSLIDTLKEYLQGYCLKMMNGHERRANAALEGVLKTIGANAKCLNDPDVSDLFTRPLSCFKA